MRMASGPGACDHSETMSIVGLPGLGADLLDGMTVKGGAAFETWLLAQQRHAAAASEAVLHEAALGSMARGALEAAIDYRRRAGGRARRILLARRAHAWDSHGYRSVSLAA
jgi:hypothetical protein